MVSSKRCYGHELSYGVNTNQESEYNWRVHKIDLVTAQLECGRFQPLAKDPNILPRKQGNRNDQKVQFRSEDWMLFKTAHS